MIDKILCLLLLTGALQASVITQRSDFISNKRHLVIYGDGIPKELLDDKLPVINSWRDDMLEVRNLCKVIQCGFIFQRASNYPNRFMSNKCYVNNNNYCESTTEKAAVMTIEKIIHEADFATTITLGGHAYGMVANSKTEDSLVFEIGDKTTGEEPDSANRALVDGNKKEI